MGKSWSSLLVLENTTIACNWNARARSGKRQSKNCWLPGSPERHRPSHQGEATAVTQLPSPTRIKGCKTSKVVPEHRSKHQRIPRQHSERSTPRASPTGTELTSKGRGVEASHHQRSSIPSDVSHETPSSCPAKSTRVGASSQGANRDWIYFTTSEQEATRAYHAPLRWPLWTALPCLAWVTRTSPYASGRLRFAMRLLRC